MTTSNLPCLLLINGPSKEKIFYCLRLGAGEGVRELSEVVFTALLGHKQSGDQKTLQLFVSVQGIDIINTGEWFLKGRIKRMGGDTHPNLPRYYLAYWDEKKRKGKIVFGLSSFFQIPHELAWR